jgi:predicted nucleic acid-binding protein
MNYLDTYALVEIGADSPPYHSIKQSEFRLCDIILAEFYWVLIRDGKKDEAEEWLNRLRPYSEPTPLEVLIEAVQFRLSHRLLNLSFPDVVGYVHAISKNGIFVTGDKGFERLPHVKYVK